MNKDDKEIRDKFKQFKYQHLKKIYEKNLSKLPENCRYNKLIILPNKYRVNVCGFDFENNKYVDLCYKSEHSRDCNAFCPKRSKELLKKEFEEEILDSQIRSTKYKDLNTLLWITPDVMEDKPQKTLFEKVLSFFRLR